MAGLLTLYKNALWAGKPLLLQVLKTRLSRGKEDSARIRERMGSPSIPRPSGRLIWVHAASVGEAQSALILIDALGKRISNTSILVTTGTVTSAALMQKRLPVYAFHQYVPVDHPDWVKSFVDHWRPDLAFWMESELWPNILMDLKKRDIPLVLVNARLSDKSFKHWSMVKGTAKELLSCFTLILAQNEDYAKRFYELGAVNVTFTDNLKYSAAPLPHDPLALSELKLAIDGRSCWVYASTHDGEEDLACRVHKTLKEKLPDLLTIIVPRHPERRDDVANTCFENALKFRLRGETSALPTPDDDIYIADTLGELGLFYSLCEIAMIGRSFSNDGGGGHNPIEAAQLGCAVLTGPNNQFQRALYDDMAKGGAVIETLSENDLTQALEDLFTHPEKLQALQEKTRAFAEQKTHIIDDVMHHLVPLLDMTESRNAA